MISDIQPNRKGSRFHENDKLELNEFPYKSVIGIYGRTL